MRRRGADHPREERDLALGKALDDLESPDYPDDFLATVWARVDAGQAAEAPPSEQAANDSTEDGGVAVRRPRPARRFWLRRPVLAAAVLLATVAVAGAAILVGLPGLSRVAGPDQVSAAEVVRKALDALSRGTSIKADVTEKYAIAILPGPTAQYAVVHARIVVGRGGSYRTRVLGRLVGPGDKRYPEAYASGLMAIMPIDPYSADNAYDARTGVVTEYWRSSEAAGYRFDERTHWPLGPPDRWANFQSDLGAMVLALRDGRATGVVATTFEGRPAWILTMMGSLALRSSTETLAVTIDQETCLPVRLQAIQDGVALLDYSLHHLRVDEPLPRDAFTATAPEGTRVHHHKGKFRRVAVAELGADSKYRLLLPTWLPDGYEQRWSAVAPRAETANGIALGRHVLEVMYTRGFDTLTVTTRTLVDSSPPFIDPFEPWVYMAEVVAHEVKLDSGAWAGATARVVVGTGITVPHVYIINGDVMVTIAGNATAQELVAIAESLHPVRQ